jgi:hypothetical protein
VVAAEIEREERRGSIAVVNTICHNKEKSSMTRIRKKLRGWKLFTTVGVLAALAIAFAQPMMRVQAQSESPSVEAAAVGSKFPSVGITVGRATLVTPDDIAVSDAAIAAAHSLTTNKPFMPTDDPRAYEASKNLANIAAAQGGGKPGVSSSSAAQPLAPPIIRGANFAGLNQSTAGGAFPPDTHGAAGPSHVVEVVNVRMSAFNKSGTQLCSFTLAALHGASEFIFDPRVVYDQAWNRWVIVSTRRSTSANDTVRRFFIAVSTSSNPCGSYFRTTFNFGGGPFNNGDWLDYPGLGMNQDAVLITGNIFDTPTGGFKFATALGIAKARLYNGLGFFVPMFTGLPGTLQPPIVYDQDKDAYFLAANNFTHLHLFRGNNMSNANEATFVQQALIDVPNYAVPPAARQPGTSIRLDTLDRRFVNASTQIGDSLWNVHTIALGSFPGPKFYELNTTTNGIKQQGFFFESGSSDDFNASITANASREAFVTYNSTDAINSNVALRHHARMRISGRQPADALGVISAGTIVATSAVALTGNPSSTAGVQRWGDYSAVSLDPQPVGACAANRRAWAINEVINSSSVWGSRVALIGFC